MKKIIKEIITFILAVISVLSLNIVVKDDVIIHDMFIKNDKLTSLVYNGDIFLKGYYLNNCIFYILLFLLFYKLLKTTLEYKDKRLIICSLSISFLFSVLEIFANCIEMSLSVDLFLRHIPVFAFKFIGLISMFYSLVSTVYYKLSNLKISSETRQICIFTNNLKSFFIIAIIIFICWLPFLLNEFPGMVGADAISQIEQALGDIPFTYHHPVIHTALIKICIDIGNLFFKSITSIIGFYTIIQMLIMAFLFSYLIYYMAKKGINAYFRLAVLLYIAFSPVFPLMSISMTKDTLFAGFMIFTLIMFIEIITNTDEFFKYKRNIVISVCIFVITMLFRNNAIYSFLLTIPIIIIYKRGYRIKVALFLCTSIFLVFGINFIINHVFKIPNGSEMEKFSVPVQQITKTLRDNREKMNEQEIQEIYSFFKTDDYDEYYILYLSDPIKGRVEEEYFANNKLEFFKLWIKLSLKYPKSYIDSYFGMISGYIFPEESRVSIWPGVLKNDLGIESKPVFEFKYVAFIKEAIHHQNIPLLGILFNIGIETWIIVLLIGFNIYRKQINEIIIFVPILMYLLTTLLGPLNNEFRYVSFLFTTVPILITFSIKELNIKYKKKKNY